MSKALACAWEFRGGWVRWPRAKVVRWLKFNLVGAIGIVVQFVALFVLKSVVHLNYLLATAAAVELAVMHNFVWHERFTWGDRTRTLGTGAAELMIPKARGAILLRFLRFNVTAGMVSLVGNLALMKLLVDFGHVNYLAANGVAIVLCSLANFLVSEEWVFG
jgi:putative flippase GtrA